MNIKKMFPPLIYQRGHDYFVNKRVSDLLYDINNEIWTANVRGTEDYFVEIDVTNIEKLIKAYCSCPAFHRNDSCKHIVAVLLAIQEQLDEQEIHNNYHIMDHWMDQLTAIHPNDVDVLSNKAPLTVEYICKWSYDRQLHVELKVGETRTFIVKDVEAFLRDVFTTKAHPFTKTFTYDPSRHYLLKKDKQILEQLYDFIKNESIYTGALFYHYNGLKKDRRTVMIPPLGSKEFLTKLTDRNLVVQFKEKNYTDIKVVDGELPLQFSFLENDQGDFFFNIDELENGTFLKPYGLWFANGTFYYPSKEQLPVVEHITTLKAPSIRLPLPIKKEKAEQFLSEALPSLEKIGEMKISDPIKEKIIKLPLHAKLYLDLKDDEMITGQLEYHYGPYQLDPFNEEKAYDKMIIRDVQKEQEIMSLIEYADFRFNGKELYIQASEIELYDFLYSILPYLDEHIDLYTSINLQKYKIAETKSVSTSIEMNEATNLLEVGFSIDGVEEEDINELLKSIIEKKRFYRLKSGAFLSLEGEDVSSVHQFFNELDIEEKDIHQGIIQMPVFRGAQIDESIKTNKIYDQPFKKLLQELKSPEIQTYPLPDDLHAELRSYQKTGYQWFKSLSNYYLGGILADDMGLGKTLQSIAYLLSEKGDQPHLVIAPSSVLFNWKNECERFAPQLQVVVLNGTKEEREEKIKTSADADVWITSYGTIRQDIDLYRDKSFKILILDEAQYIKNYATKTSQAIRQLKVGRTFALSGTPVENSLNDLWSIFQVVLPGLLPSKKKFSQLEPNRVLKITKPFILRRVKEDVLKELPDKIESVHVSELNKEQKELYIGYLKRLQEEASKSLKGHSFNNDRMKILAGLTRLRQICCHPSLFLENYSGDSGKLNQLMEIIQTSMANNKRMLIFSQFTSMHEIIIKHLEQEGIDYFYLHGQTQAEERTNMSVRFNEGEKNIFLVSLRAGGTGLNLTGADTVILYDLWWNPAVEDQATSRAHRLGQKNVVQVIRLISEGTIEEKIYQLQQKKRQLIDQVIQPGETMLSSLSEDDIKEILNI